MLETRKADRSSPSKSRYSLKARRAVFCPIKVFGASCLFSAQSCLFSTPKVNRSWATVMKPFPSPPRPNHADRCPPRIIPTQQYTRSGSASLWPTTRTPIGTATALVSTGRLREAPKTGSAPTPPLLGRGAGAPVERDPLWVLEHDVRGTLDVPGIIWDLQVYEMVDIVGVLDERNEFIQRASAQCITLYVLFSVDVTKASES